MHLYVKEKNFFSGYLCLCCKGKREKYVDLCPKTGQGTASLKLRQIVLSYAYQISFFFRENRNHFTGFHAIVRLRRGSSTILWQKATIINTIIIVVLFAGRIKKL